MMRAVAALWVMLYHYRVTLGESGEGSWYLVGLNHGYLGVAIFFVISGYCIMASLQRMRRKRESGGRFMLNRALRIMPTYWMALIVMAFLPFVAAGAGWLAGNGFTINRLTWWKIMQMDIIGWVKQLTLTSALGGGEYRTYLLFPFNGICWSLAIEMQFYVVMAITLLFGMRQKWVMASVLVLGLLSMNPAQWFETGEACMRSADWMIEGTFLPYWSMFFVGVLGYELIERGIYPKRIRQACLENKREVTWWLGMAIFVNILSLWVTKMNANTITATATGVCLWGMYGVQFKMGALEKIKCWIKHTMMRLGEMSYSIYLMHLLLMSSAVNIAKIWYRDNGFAMYLIACLSCLLMCAAFYYACEKPMTLLIKRWRNKRKPNHDAMSASESITKIQPHDRMAA